MLELNREPTEQNTGPQTDFKEKAFRDEIISFVNKEFERRQTERIPWALQWELNNAFLVGNQYADINPTSQSIQEIPKLYWWQIREVYNHIASIIETRQSKLNVINPSLLVRPATTERADISTSRICTAVVKGTYNKVEMKSLISEATSWSEQCGTVFYKNIWNPNQGRLIGELDGQKVYEGDITVNVVPPYEIFPDSPFSQDVDFCRSMIHAKAYHIDEIEEIWGKRVQGREIDVFSLSQSKIGLGGLGYTASVQKVTNTKKKNCEVVIEYYEKPTKKFPNGRLIIVAGKELLFYGDLPYLIGEDETRGFPFVRQVCILRPGMFWGASVIERLIPVQRAYNSVKNRKHEYLNRVAIGVMTAEDGTVDTEDLEAEGLSPGKLILHSRGSQRPQMMENASLPPDFRDEEQKLLNEFIHISGVSELARESGVPTGTGSGIALSILKEQDDNRLALVAAQIRDAVIRAGKHWLRLYKQYAQGIRMLRYVGKENDVMVMDWQASDITSTDISIESENELSSSPAQRKQMVYDLLNAGLFNDPNTGKIDARMRAKILQMLELGNWEQATDLADLHIAKAVRENMFMQKGELRDVAAYDDHEIHIAEHNKFRLSAEFEQIAVTDNAMLPVAMDYHVQQHEVALSIKIQQAALQMMAAQENGGVQNG